MAKRGRAGTNAKPVTTSSEPVSITTTDAATLLGGTGQGKSRTGAWHKRWRWVSCAAENCRYQYWLLSNESCIECPLCGGTKHECEG